VKSDGRKAKVKRQKAKENSKTALPHGSFLPHASRGCLTIVKEYVCAADGLR